MTFASNGFRALASLRLLGMSSAASGTFSDYMKSYSKRFPPPILYLCTSFLLSYDRFSMEIFIKSIFFALFFQHAEEVSLFRLRMPPKQIINNTSNEFVQKRQRDLENYLLVSHVINFFRLLRIFRYKFIIRLNALLLFQTRTPISWILFSSLYSRFFKSANRIPNRLIYLLWWQRNFWILIPVVLQIGIVTKKQHRLYLNL